MEPNYLQYAQLINQAGDRTGSLAQLGQSIDQAQEMALKRQQVERANRLSDLQIQSGQLDLDKKRKDAQNLADLNTLLAGQSSRQIPMTLQSLNPEYAADQAGRVGPPQVTLDPLMNELTGGAPGQPGLEYPGQGAPSPSPTVETATTRPMTEMEKAKEMQDFLKSRGMFDQLATIGKTEDVTAKIGKQKTEELSTMMAIARKAAAAGNDPKVVLAQLGQLTGQDTSALQNMNFSPDGAASVMTLPNGAGTLITYFDGEKTISHFAKPEESWGAPYEDTVGGKRVLLRKSNTGKVEPIVQDTSTTVKVSTGGDKTDPIVAREAVKDLPKLRREANMAEASKARISQMISLMDKGSAGGLKGNVLTAISGIFDVPATSEADLFKKLASAGAGQLRSTVIGPGQVSNYEQKLLQSVSGGGIGARTAVRELLTFYQQEADRTINNYNDASDSAALVAPNVSKAFPRIGSKQSDASPKGGKPIPKGATIRYDANGNRVQ